jgi:bis(5'-nucleosyl)-tetraphosphatase (symmetrical)
MATWIVGDVHGWLEVFENLLRRIGFEPERDRLWLAGDLVNRGPDSLGMVRRARQLEQQLGDRFACVLGNHDLHLLAAVAGLARKKSPYFEEFLAAKDAEELADWLRHRPLVHHEDDNLLVHAGLWPEWTAQDAVSWARQLEQLVRKRKAGRKLLDPKDVPAGLEAEGRALYAFTTLRTCTVAGEPCNFKGTPEVAPAGCLPWFAVPGRRSADAQIYFGHWAALGLHLENGVVGLDSGCAWGGSLTAIRLEDGKIVQEPNRAHPSPRS